MPTGLHVRTVTHSLLRTTGHVTWFGGSLFFFSFFLLTTCNVDHDIVSDAPVRVVCKHAHT